MINVTSSVGTRGSSIVHSNSSREKRKEKRMKKFYKKIKVPRKCSLPKPGSRLDDFWLTVYRGVFGHHKQICRVRQESYSHLHERPKRKQMWEVFGVQCDKTEPNYTKGVTSKTLLASFSYEFQTKVLDTLYTGVLHHTEDITHLEWMVWLYMNPSYHVRRYRPALQLVILSAHVP